MGETPVIYLSEFEWEVLQLYIKHGYGFCKLYETSFFSCSMNDKTVLMTLDEFADIVVDYDNDLWRNKK